MFKNCGIVIVQERGKQRDFVEVNLINPRKLTDKEVWRGRWIMYTNSREVGFRPKSTTYTIGTSAHPESKFWMYEMASNTLYFCEMENLVGGGLSYGEVLSDYKTTLACLRAKITPEGIFPIHDVSEEKADVLVPSNILLKGQPTTWTWEYIS
jgi:hypothetical protein